MLFMENGCLEITNKFVSSAGFPHSSHPDANHVYKIVKLWQSLSTIVHFRSQYQKLAYGKVKKLFCDHCTAWLKNCS